MAVTQNSYIGNGSTTTYSFTFPYLKASDIKASLDAVDTTAFTLPTATTLQFNSAPANGVKIKIFRETATDNLTATFYAGSAIKSEDLNENFTQNLYSTQEISSRYLSNLGGTMVGNFGLGEDADIVFEGATDNTNETTITVADPTADRTITFPDTTGTVVTTGDTGTVTSTMLADGTIAAGDLASNSVTTAKIVDSNVTTAKIAADAVTGAKIADDQINSEHYVAGSIDTEHIANSQITNAKMADNSVNTAELVDDAVTAAKLASNSVVSASIVDGSIATADIADNAITNAKMADDSVGAAELVDTSVGTAALASNAVTNAKMADSSVGTSELVNDSVTTVKIANSQVTTAKIADSNVTTAKINNDAVTSAKIADNAIGNEHLQDDSVRTAEIQASAVTNAKIADNAVTTAKILDGSISTAKIAENAVLGSKITNNTIAAGKLQSNSVTADKIASNAVTTDKIADAELTTLAGMQSGTASILASSTALTATTTEINQLDGKTIQTTVADNDAQLPTSGAIVDYVAAQIAPLGGLEVIATEVAFPNTQPASGVVISISDAGGIVVNGSGVSTTGRTVGGSTVTINGFPSSVQSSTLAASMGLMVSSTGSSQTYTYHKLLGKESDITALSDDINDFNNRYRVSSSAPTSSLDNGDLWFDTANGKMMVYNGTSTAWEEVSAVGSFNINTLSSSGNTGGGSATFNGTAYRFTLSNPPQDAQQLLVSINGVVQKPNSGSSQPSEGFAISGNDIIFSAAPPSGSISFIITLGQSVQIGTPSDNTISTAKIQNLAVTTDKIADDAVTAAKLSIVDNARLDLGTSNDLHLIHDGTNSYLQNITGVLYINNTSGTATNLIIKANNNIELQPANGETGVKAVADAQVELYYDNSKKFNTESNGATVTGRIKVTGNGDVGLIHEDGIKAVFGNSNDLKIYHDGSHSYLEDSGTGRLIVKTNYFEVDNAAGNEAMIEAVEDGAVSLYHNGSKRFGTQSNGFEALGGQFTFYGQEGGASQLLIYADEGDDNDDRWRVMAGGSNDFVIGNLADASWDTNIKAFGNGAVELYYDDSKKLETTSQGVDVTGTFKVISGGTEVQIQPADGLINFGMDGRSSFVTGENACYIYSGSGSGGSMPAGDLILQSRSNVNRTIRFVTGSTPTQRMSIDTGGATLSGDFLPDANDTRDLGSNSTRWDGIYGTYVSAKHSSANTATNAEFRNEHSVYGGGVRFKSNNTYGTLELTNTDGSAAATLVNTTGGWHWSHNLILGQNIAFNGETANANELDDYEEGSFTATIDPASGSVSSYYNQEGSYTKIGRLVKCHFRLRVNDAGNASGSMAIAGLPFTVADVLSSTGLDGSGGPSYWAGQGQAITHMTIVPEGNSTRAFVYIAGSNGASTLANLSNSNAFGDGWDVRAEVMYFTAS